MLVSLFTEGRAFHASADVYATESGAFVTVEFAEQFESVSFHCKSIDEIIAIGEAVVAAGKRLKGLSSEQLVPDHRKIIRPEEVAF